MKKILYLSAILFLISFFSYSQVSLTSNIVATQLVKQSNQNFKYKFGISNNFNRGYVHTYLSTDNTLDSSDIYLGSERILGHYFDNGQTKEIKRVIPSSLPKSKYFIILKTKINFIEQIFASQNNYCFNLTDDSQNCDPVTGKPDLRVQPSNVAIVSECNSCSSFLDMLGSNRHIISREAGILTFNMIIVDNIGTANASSSKINFYLSSDTTLDSNDYKFYNFTSTPSIVQNQYVNVAYTLFGSDFPYNQAYGNYYILMKVDGDNQLNELNENNNLSIVPIRFRQNINSGKLMEETLSSTVYNFQGEEIKQISDSKLEESEIENLPKGIYIIKYSNGESKKISK